MGEEENGGWAMISFLPPSKHSKLIEKNLIETKINVLTNHLYTLNEPWDFQKYACSVSLVRYTLYLVSTVLWELGCIGFNLT